MHRSWLKWQRVLRVLGVFWVLVFAGCTGQVRAAMIQHAHASAAVAMTLERAASMLKCVEPSGACPAVREVITGQALALRDSTGRLERAARE